MLFFSVEEVKVLRKLFGAGGRLQYAKEQIVENQDTTNF